MLVLHNSPILIACALHCYMLRELLEAPTIGKMDKGSECEVTTSWKGQNYAK